MGRDASVKDIMHVNTGTGAWHNNGSCCYFYSTMRVSVYTTQYRLDTSWVPAGMGVHGSPRLAHVLGHMHVGLHVYLVHTQSVYTA